ncbi:hypothetical protein HUJ04_000545 [Dendroctonus ponderosae]|nr:hypothetical protein HUJ04_000545 [Dendroctonus ponderosae]
MQWHIQVSLTYYLYETKAKRDKGLAGRYWLEGYLRRNPHIRLRKPESTSIIRVTAFNKEETGIFFANLSAVRDKSFNCDVTGITTEQRPSKIYAEKGQKRVGRLTNWEMGKTATHFEHCVESSKEDPILLLLDNHSSHCSLNSYNFCKERGMILLRLLHIHRTVFNSFTSNTKSCMFWNYYPKTKKKGGKKQPLQIFISTPIKDFLEAKENAKQEKLQKTAKKNESKNTERRFSKKTKVTFNGCKEEEETMENSDDEIAEDICIICGESGKNQELWLRLCLGGRYSPLSPLSKEIRIEQVLNLCILKMYLCMYSRHIWIPYENIWLSEFCFWGWIMDMILLWHSSYLMEYVGFVRRRFQDYEKFSYTELFRKLLHMPL